MTDGGRTTRSPTHSAAFLGTHPEPARLAYYLLRAMARHASKKKTQKRHLYEQRFLPEATQTTRPAFYAGLAASVFAGAGVYAQWIADPPLGHGTWLLAAAIIGYAVAFWLGASGVHPVRVGDAGIAVESGELERILWCDLERLWIARDALLAKGPELTLRIPLGPQSLAAAWAIQEAAQRVPDVIEVKRSFMDKLPKPTQGSGERVRVEGFPVVGRDCAASNEAISFERDARVCSNCAEVYLNSKVPGVCVTCDRPLGSSAIALGD